MSKFTKQEQEKFYKDLQNINLDSDSEMEDSFYAKEITRVQQQLASVRNAKHNFSILEELKKNIKQEDQMITEYQNEVTQLHRITKNQQKNVIDDKILNEIKIKVAQSNNNSILQLADQQYNQSVLNQSLLEQQQLLTNKSFFKKSKVSEQIKIQQQAIMKKIQLANAQREWLTMEKEDKRSMKYEMQCLSSLFSQRFIRPKLKPLQQKDSKIQLATTKIRNTFTNLVPQPINQSTILPKNAPEIALKQLKIYKKKPLRSISTTEVKITQKQMDNNPENYQQVQPKLKQKSDLNKQNLEKIFINYVEFVSKFLQNIKKISKSYSPKFIKYLQDSEKNINYQFNEEIGKKEKSLSQVASSQNAKDIKQFKLTFESVTNLKGIQEFVNIQDAQFQFNAISNIQPLQQCRKLIQLNISYNKLKDIGSISHLPWLRLLNIEHNLISQLKINCPSLEILSCGHNLIQDMDLNSNNYLRILLLNNNKINQLPKLQLYNLEEINLSKNQLRSIINLEQLILLKKLNLSGNRLEQLDGKIIYLYLNELNLSNNYLTKLNLFFLPCLQRLYLNNNKIAIRSNFEMYLPNLKVLNVDENRLEGFSPIWQFLLYSRNVEFIKYNNNEYFLNLREKIREIYQYIVYKYMRNIKIINENNMDIGIKKYYEQNYDIYFGDIEFFRSNNNAIKYIESNIKFILHEFTFGSELEANKNSFIKEKEYILEQSIQKIDKVQKIIQFIKLYSQKKSSIVSLSSSLFYHFDQYQLKRRNLFHNIRTMVIHNKYKRQKRLKHYKTIKPKVVEKLTLFRQLIMKSEKIKCFVKFYKLLKGLNQNQAAIKIQKVWRGYVRRKLYKKILKMKKSKQADSDSDFEDVDTDFFHHQLQKYEFNIQDIEGLNFEENVIIRPEVFDILHNRQRNQDERNNKAKQNKAKQQNAPLKNNFIESQSKFKQKNGEKTNEEKMIKEWGITNQTLLKTLQYKQQKRMAVRKKQQQKYLTAGQRFQRFKKG